MFLWNQNDVRRFLASASGLHRSHERGWVVSSCNRAKKKTRRNDTYFVVRTIKRRNRPRRFHSAFIKIRRDRRTPVVRLSGEPPRDQNQSSAPPVIYYNRLTHGEAKETHLVTYRSLIKTIKTGNILMFGHLNFPF